jgi:hypothetical protein
LVSPAGSCNYQQGLASGLLQRQSCLDSLSFWTQKLEESKVQIDLPQLRGRMQKSREESGRITAVPLRPMRQDFQR